MREQPPDRFVPAELSELPPTVQQQLHDGALALFRPEALPFDYHPDLYNPTPASRPGDAKIRVFAAADKTENDLVELTWKSRDILLRWVQARNIWVLEFSLESFQSENSKSDDDVGQSVQLFLSEVMRLHGETDFATRAPYDIKFPWPDTLKDGLELTSDADRDFVGMRRWQDRVDIVIDKRQIKVITYHQPVNLAYFEDGSQFFPEEFRKTVLARMRARKPLP